jgi:ABC-type uncharacterized transport system involved in gliding motility auxiliary subunit
MKKYSYLPGFVLLAAACVHAALALAWAEIDIVMAVAGAGIVLASLGINWPEVRAWFREPGGIFAINTGLSFVVLIAILVLVNFLARSHPASLDLTATGRNTLSRGTLDFLGRLQRDVTLRQFGRGHDARLDLMLASFADASTHIRVDFADVDRAKREASGFGITKAVGTVVVSVDATRGGAAGVRFRKVEEVNEPALVTAMLQLLNDRKPTVCFVTGHGEHGLLDDTAAGISRAAKVLEATNFDVSRISLLEGDIAKDCSAVVLAGPRQPFQPGELERLSAYLQSGGRLAVMLDPPPDPGLVEWVRAWGVVPVAGTVFDTSGANQIVGGGPDTVLITSYGKHPITSAFEISTVLGRACPLVTGPSQYGGQPAVVAQTSPRSFVKTGEEASTIEFDPRTDKRGPIPVVAANDTGVPASLPVGQRRSDRVRLVVFGDSDFISNNYLFLLANRDLFLRTISWLVGEEDVTVVNVQERENRRVVISQAAKGTMWAVNLIVLPIIPLIAGIIVVIRAKR